MDKCLKDDLKSMEQNEVWDLVELPEGCKRFGVSGSLRQNVTQLATSKVTRRNLFQKVSLIRMASTIKKHFYLYLEKIHQEL